VSDFHEMLSTEEMTIIRLALADRVGRLDKLIREFPNACEPDVITRRDEAQALRTKLLPALIYIDK
jgi:hypothetical protein